MDENWSVLITIICWDLRKWFWVCVGAAPVTSHGVDFQHQKDLNA